MIKKILLKPFEKFEQIESLSGVLLIFATIVALIWANSPYADLYNSIWHYHIGITTDDFNFTKTIHHWINDGLMAVFFFLIGLEIKRELLIGELNSLRKAAFPFFAAMGAMLIPVGLYFLLNERMETAEGWAIPMATDIAFSLAILKLLGDRVPIGLKVFLTAFAIVDDLGAVLVIAIFYSADMHLSYLLIAFILLGILFYLSYRQIYAKYILFIFGIAIWFLFLKSGIHPTIAGVLLALTIPVRQDITVESFQEELDRIVYRLKLAPALEKPILSNEQLESLDNLESWTDSVQSPLQELEHNLHGYVAYFIIPLFALSNAGISFGEELQLDFALITTISVALVGGKFIGVTLVAWLAEKFNLAEIPDDVRFRQIIGVSFLAGVGFTMSIFVANLSFPSGSTLLDSAKAGILAGSVIAGLLGYIILRVTIPPAQLEQ
jgi:NhaA family Na+:H+ antiporter